MTPAECICFKPTGLEEELGIDEAAAFYELQIAEGSEEREYFERLAILYRHKSRIDDEIGVLRKAVGVFERIVFEDKIESALPVLNMFTVRLREARSLVE
jgi:hypothetical protein